MPSETLINQQILEQLRSDSDRGRNVGYVLLRKNYGPYLMGVIKKTIRSYKELDGAMLFDESLEKISEKSPAFNVEDAGKLKTWLTTVVRNHCIDAIRKEESKQRKAERAARMPQVESDSEDGFSFLKGVDADQLLSNLKSEAQRKCLYYKFVNRMKYKEISEKMHLPINTVRSHIRRGKAQLKKVLKAQS